MTKQTTVQQIITLNVPGANPAAAGLPMEGWENKAWEKADILDWDTLLSLEVDPPLGINSLAEGFGVCLKKNNKLHVYFKWEGIESAYLVENTF